MDSSWFLDDNFNDISDDFLNDVINFADFPLEDVEPELENWDIGFQNLEPPSAKVLESLAAEFGGGGGGCGNRKMEQKPSQEKQQPTNFNRKPVGKDSVFRTSSPVSVLENSSTCSSENLALINSQPSFPVKGNRSKRIRRSNFNVLIFQPFPASNPTHPFFDSENCGKKKLAKKRNLAILSGCTKEVTEEPEILRKCTHCQVTNTPQWREGPSGPKTLCNACGVRYRSGRLLPEYRPAASPTFIPTLHSNSHKKVIEMRRKIA